MKYFEYKISASSMAEQIISLNLNTWFNFSGAKLICKLKIKDIIVTRNPVFAWL